MIGTFLFSFIPRLICCGCFDGERGDMSIGFTILIYLVFTIYAYISWGILRGIIMTIGLIVYGGLFSGLLTALDDCGV